ncbi:hypothetical protein [Chryseobacterium sp. UNC8MFCol]|uniref:hypothetical protein n=1 Tax=Chryseobacterium sp. UNC8MFCol TaxID=1340435 RepID=UPI00048147AF|nr:hypothetical protein [Chryseobacterium sp. UNC8MFCol]
MIETYINISVNRKTDIDVIKDILIRNKIDSPIYIAEYEGHFNIYFTSTYEQWELDKQICQSFPGYDLSTDMQRGRKEIRLEISRHQSELCTTDWGYPIDNPLNETKYLIKKASEKGNDAPIKFNPEIRVLFGSEEQTYYINIIPGIKNSTQEKGFLLLNEFKCEADPEITDFFPDTLYKTPVDAFNSGRDKIEDTVNKDYAEYQAIKKKQRQQREKFPRKIIREFIKNCNSSNYDDIVKDLAPDIHFEIRVNWRQKLTSSGLDEFKNYLEASYQELCKRDFKIKSSWSFHDQDVRIILDTFTPPAKTDEAPKNNYRIFLNFRIEEAKITQILLEK